MYQVNLSNQARKSLKKLDYKFQDKVLKSLRLLEVDPFLGEKMGGQFKGSFRIKIPPLRIIYTPDFSRKIILVEAIGHKGDIYK
ncbi:type II toxin-antitoxin system RelE/ParE family toxin [Candidatus Daviesbacteria bacterium]|nr:type II toxin-antitoxin system RelE/ParE family toxin [Candidatus Daviesbacteria bacterium]